MVQSKRMDESAFSKIVKDLTSVGELIRIRQEEQQSVLNEFEQEKKRYKLGKISKKALSTSAKQINKELSKINKDLIKGIKKARIISMDIIQFVAKQSQKALRVKAVGGARKSKKKKRR